MSVGRICSRVVVTAAASEPVLDVAKRMAKQNVGTVVVVSEASHPVGMVTDRDVVVRCVAAELDPKSTPVATIMTRVTRCVDESVAVEEALRTMAASGKRRLIVTGELGALRGVLSLDDVMEQIAKESESIGTLLRHASARLTAAD